LYLYQIARSLSTEKSYNEKILFKNSELAQKSGLGQREFSFSPSPHPNRADSLCSHFFGKVVYCGNYVFLKADPHFLAKNGGGQRKKVNSFYCVACLLKMRYCWRGVRRLNDLLVAFSLMLRAWSCCLDQRTK
jgi:hypothetical protein